MKRYKESTQDTTSETVNDEGKTETGAVHETTTCPECDSQVIEEDNESVCSECGLVVNADPIDHGPEWRAFSSSERQDRSRVGSPKTELMHDKGLSTTIDWKDKDAAGNRISQRKRAQMGRLRKMDGRVKKSAEGRQLKKAIVEIKRMGSALGAPQSIRETAVSLYRTCYDSDLIRGYSIEAIASACLYYSFRVQQSSRGLDEIVTVARGTNKRDLGRAYNHINNELGLSAPVQKAEEFIPRFTTKIGGSQALEKQARRFAQAAQDTHLVSGTDPTGIAGATIYLAGLVLNEDHTQNEVADAAGVTNVTIRNRYQDIQDELDIEELKIPEAP